MGGLKMSKAELSFCLLGVNIVLAALGWQSAKQLKIDQQRSDTLSRAPLMRYLVKMERDANQADQQKKLDLLKRNQLPPVFLQRVRTDLIKPIAL